MDIDHTRLPVVLDIKAIQICSIFVESIINYGKESTLPNLFQFDTIPMVRAGHHPNYMILLK